MKDLTTDELATVAGGASPSTQLTQTLTQIQSSISELSQSNTHGHSGFFPLLMAAALMNQQRPAPTVVAAPGATVVGGW